MESSFGRGVSQAVAFTEVATARTADVLVDILASAGVDVVFALPGGPIAPILDALIDRPDIRVVITRHESGALFAAAGYAHATGRLGVAAVTSGPGVLNAMTGLASAYSDSLPLLLLVGEVPRGVQGKGALQDGSAHNLNIVGMASHITKLTAEVVDPNAAPAMLRRAMATAMSGRRGPVVLTLPIDLTVSSIAVPEIAVDVSTSYGISEATLDRAAALLNESRSTAIFAGSGVRPGAGPARLKELAERLQCPVITTPKGKGVFPEDHPLSLGVFGIGGHPSASAFLESGVDVLLGIGSSFGELQTEGWSSLLRPRVGFIHVDIEAQQIGKNYPVTLGVAAPAHEFLGKLAVRLPQQPRRSFGGVRTHTRAEIASSVSGRIAPQRALWEIQQVLPPDTIFTNDAGEHTLFSIHYLKAHRADSFVLMIGLGSMGSSIGAALGAQLAHPDRVVAAICGDGCFAMNAFEVATAVAERLPILVFVMNDERLGMVEIGDTATYGRTPSYPTSPMKVAGLAAALGAQSVVVDSAGQILASDLLRMRESGPVVIEVRIDPAIKMPKKERFKHMVNRAGRKIIN